MLWLTLPAETVLCMSCWNQVTGTVNSFVNVTVDAHERYTIVNCLFYFISPAMSSMVQTVLTSPQAKEQLQTMSLMSPCYFLHVLTAANRTYTVKVQGVFIQWWVNCFASFKYPCFIIYYFLIYTSTGSWNNFYWLPYQLILVSYSDKCVDFVIGVYCNTQQMCGCM